MANLTYTRAIVALLVTVVVFYHAFFRTITSTTVASADLLSSHGDEHASVTATTTTAAAVIPVTSTEPKTEKPKSPHSQHHPRPNGGNHEKPIKGITGPPAMGIVSMHYGQNDLYDQAIESHIRHAKRWGYPVYILRRDILEGIWSKLAYLLHVLVLEMEKDENERTKWLMWFDADSVLINPALPLDIFTPPADFADIHLLATKDQNGFNAGMFFIRVHPKSIRMISKALAFPQYKSDVYLDFIEQTAMYSVLNETEFRNHVLYQPRIWYNTYEFHHAYEGQKGDILVHFPGLEEDRWKHMKKWLDIVEGPEQAKWEVPLDETRYPAELEKFWTLLRDGIQAMEAVRDKFKAFEKIPHDVQSSVRRLETALWGETDQAGIMTAAIDEVRRALGIRNETDTRARS